MTWRADLELSYLDEDGNEVDAPDVVGGYAEFVVINVGQHPIGDLLDSLSADTAHFAPLFEDEEVAEAVQEQFEDVPFNRVLIVTLVEVAEPLRGNGLGAWLVTELVGRMASPTDTNGWRSGASLCCDCSRALSSSSTTVAMVNSTSACNEMRVNSSTSASLP